jgi:hypothetical protein
MSLFNNQYLLKYLSIFLEKNLLHAMKNAYHYVDLLYIILTTNMYKDIFS